MSIVYSLVENLFCRFYISLIAKDIENCPKFWFDRIFRM